MPTMPSDFWNYQARRPRHQAVPGVATIVEARSSGETAWSEGELLDVSRNGLRFQSADPFEGSEQIEIRIPFAGRPDLNRIAHAAIRWRHFESRWIIAVELEQPMDWEVIGELILNGALATCESTDERLKL